MAAVENLRDIINRQKETLAHLEAEYQAIKNSDASQENSRLKAELEKLRNDYEKSKLSASILARQNAELKNALYEQIYNEKVKILNNVSQKIDIYFRANINGEQNRLFVFENNVRSRIDHMLGVLQKNNIDSQDEIYSRIEELSLLLHEKVTAARNSYAQRQMLLTPDERAEFEALRNGQITGEQITAITKKNNLERFVGLNLLNAVGILLLIVGVITAARYTYLQLPDLLKGIMMFTFGAGMLITGELMNQKKPNVFSLGMTSGGVGILYAALATSYFGLRIIEMYPALLICLLITAVSFILSNRYHSQVILGFALIGGYLPIFSISGGAGMIYGAMVYFIILNLLVLMMSFRNKWTITSYIGFTLNTLGTIYICAQFIFTTSAIEKAAAVLYVLFTFLSYTLVPIVGTYRTKSRFRAAEIVLIAVNTFFSSLIMYLLFYLFGLKGYTGLLTIMFASVYLLLGRLIRRKFTGEKNTQALFYLTGMAFVILVIPFQFGSVWLSLGWLAEGVLFTSYGILNNEKRYERVGLVINGLCLLAFLWFDLWWFALYSYKYLAVTLGSLIILGSYLYKRKMEESFPKVYKYFVIVNLWCYMLYLIGDLDSMLNRVSPSAYNLSYLTSALAIMMTFLIAYTVTRIKAISGVGVKIMASILYIIGILGLVCLNAANSLIYNEGAVSLAVILTGTMILLVIGLLSVLALYDLLQQFRIKGNLGIEWYPLIVSGYFVIILTQNLITQYHLSFSSAAISILYVLAAFVWIIFGFIRRYSMVRRFGLGLSALAVIKLFLIDLFSVTQGYRIVSYFALGVTLIGISFVYQHFIKRLELTMEESKDAEEKH